ncbi:MAG: STAS domain-containing protein [Magnetococcales bacterium]|nr:STAS domain-containing protein [Magnetococcales bacterium]
MSCQISFEDQKLKIIVDGMFTHRVWQAIDGFAVDLAEVKSVEVDFSKTVFVDSGGIGCLMLLKDKVGDDINVSLTNTNRDVHKIITTANLAEIFTVA